VLKKAKSNVYDLPAWAFADEAMTAYRRDEASPAEPKAVSRSAPAAAAHDGPAPMGAAGWPVGPTVGIAAAALAALALVTLYSVRRWRRS
jgi:hypothetical protein